MQVRNKALRLAHQTPRGLTCSVLTARPSASMGTRVPAKSCIKKGVMKTAPNVVQMVIITDSGTSP